MNGHPLLTALWARILHHLAFWSISYYILVHAFTSSAEIQPVDYIYTVVFLITMAIGVYLNLYLLIPLFLNTRRYFLFSGLLATCILAGTWFNLLVFSNLIDLFLPGYYFISYFDFADILKFMAAFIGITSLFKLSKGYFILLGTRNQITRLQKEKADAELQALRAQINPHFLFNSLNSIYSMVLKNSEKAPETILRLSEILRYILYETRKERVALSTEINYMQDYISLQRLRCGSNARIDVKINGAADDRKITPLLFLPLIENSFKHGIKGETGPVFVNLEWTVRDNSVMFTAENNKGQADDEEPDRPKGIGLENLKKRLEMAYRDHHQFDVTETENRFNVCLTIYTKEDA